MEHGLGSGFSEGYLWNWYLTWGADREMMHSEYLVATDNKRELGSLLL